jgi:hypothetical protein
VRQAPAAAALAAASGEPVTTLKLTRPSMRDACGAVHLPAGGSYVARPGG